jgi:hypothetical protein
MLKFPLPFPFLSVIFFHKGVRQPGAETTIVYPERSQMEIRDIKIEPKQRLNWQ